MKNSFEEIIEKLKAAKSAIEECNEMMGIDNTDDEQVLQLNDLIDYYIEVNSFGY
jgi:hypothetical protein